MLKVSRLVGMFGLVALLVAGVALSVTSVARAQEKDKKKKKWDIVRAHRDLRVVHRDLKTLKKGKYGGHRTKAIEHIEASNKHLTAAAKHVFKGKLPKAWTATLPKATKKTSFKKLHMDLVKAHRDMKAAKAGAHGGHRVKALEELDKAIEEAKKGVAFEKKTEK